MAKFKRVREDKDEDDDGKLENSDSYEELLFPLLPNSNPENNFLHSSHTSFSRRRLVNRGSHYIYIPEPIIDITSLLAS